MLGCAVDALAQFRIGMVDAELLKGRRPTTLDEIEAIRKEGQSDASRSQAQFTPMAAGTLVWLEGMIQHSNFRIGRRSTRKVVVFATHVETRQVRPYVDFVLSPLRSSSAEGHNHGDPPTGSLSTHTGNSGPSGLDFVIEYTAPEASSTAVTYASCSSPSGFTCFPDQYYQFSTYNAGLEPLPPNPTIYELIGQTSTHPENHFGVPSFIAKIQSASALYLARYEGPSSFSVEHDNRRQWS